MRIGMKRSTILALPFLVAALAAAACAGPTDAPPAAPEKSEPSRATPSPDPGASAAGAPAPGASSAGDASAPVGTAWAPCGTSTCRHFATPDAALRAILDEEKPLVVGFGEAHAQKGTETIASTAARTTAQLLPVLGGRASDVVLELWIADGKCGAKQEKKVAEQQKEVTAPQAATNTNEYVVLAERAKALAIQPHVIRPSCADVDKVAKAGENGVLEMLTIITQHMEAKVVALRARPGAEAKLITTYGGAMHNDLAPKEGREGWSFGPALAKATGDRYVEVDLIVPEYVKDTPAWTSQRWFAAWGGEKEKGAVDTLAIRQGDRSYAIVLPRGVTKEGLAGGGGR